MTTDAMPITEIELRSISSADSSARPGPSNATVSTPNQEPTNPPTMEKKKEDPLGELASRITIAGIEDAYKAKSKVERYTYIGAIVFGVFAMLYSSAFIAKRYVSQDPNEINRAEILQEKAPFPNVTVCLPQMINYRAMNLLVIPPKALRQMAKYNISVEEMLEFAASGTNALHGGKEKESPLKSGIGIRILDASLDASPRVLQDVMKAPCEESFFKCDFGGNPFDCCSVAEYMLLDHGSCWHFDMNTIERRISSNSSRSNNLNPSGLAIDVIADKRLVIPDDNVLPDEFIVHIDQIPSMVSTPEVIPFGADAHIILKEPVQLHQITRCQSNEHLPHLTRMGYYDSNAVFCVADKVLTTAAELAGCDPIPFLNFVPFNETRCGSGMLLGVLRAFGGELDTGTNALTNIDFDKLFYYWILETFKRCRPLCNRWSYSVYSSSYGYIRYRQDVQATYENVSMTRLRVYFQDSAYQQRIEEHSNLIYLAFCEVGGVWGVYLGVSIISILQTIAYGFIMWRKRKELRVRSESNSGEDSHDNGSLASKEPPKDRSTSIGPSNGPPKKIKNAWV